jgi:hypothetical protein
MKKAILIAAAVALIATPAVFAQDSVIWLDQRANDTNGGLAGNAFHRTITGTLIGNNGNNPFTFGVNGGRRGAGQTLFISPRHADGFELGTGFPNMDMDSDSSTGSLWIYMDVNDDASGTGDVIASVGLDTDVLRLTPADPARNTLADISLNIFDGTSGAGIDLEEVFNSITPTGQNPWNNHVDGAIVAGSPPQWEGAKAVRVAVDPGPVYNASLGMEPNLQGPTDAPYRIGRIELEAGTRNCQFLNPVGGHRARSTFNVFLKNNNLLTVRTYDGVGDAEELVSYGYDGAVPEVPPASGNDMNASSTVPDAVVAVVLKGDFGGDGNVTSADTTAYLSKIPINTDVEMTYLGDFTGDVKVTSADTTAYLDAITRSLSCP